MNELLKEVLKRHSKLIKEDDQGRKYILRKDLDKLEMSDKAKNFLKLSLKVNNIKVKDTPRKSKNVKDLNYGQSEAYGLESFDKPKIADIQYNDGEIVEEKYDKLEQYIIDEFIPNNVQVKRNVSRNNKDESLKQPYRSIQLKKIVGLGLSDKELKRVLEILEEKSIHVGGKSQDLDGENLNYDYITTYDTVKNYTDKFLKEKISWEEMKDKFMEYHKTGDPKLREELIIKSLKMVPYCTWSMALKYNIDRQELDSYGYEALMRAVDNFDPTKGYTFVSYAMPCIRFGVKNGIRSQQKLRTDLFSKFHTIKRIVEEDYGCTLEEEPDMMDDILDVMESQGFYNPNKRDEYRGLLTADVSLDEIQENYDLVDDRSEEELFNNLYRIDFDKEIIKIMNKRLTEREKQVLIKRWGLIDDNPKSLAEVAESMGVTRERIRQIEAKAIRKIRHQNRRSNIESYRGADFGNSRDSSFDNTRFVPKENSRNIKR